MIFAETGLGVSGARSSIARAAVTNSMAIMWVRFEIAVRNLRAADHPIETWSSCIADEGMESTLAGVANRLFSLTSAACVYWAIISPESTPGSSARNGGSPALRFLSKALSVLLSAMLPRSATAIAKKSRT